MYLVIQGKIIKKGTQYLYIKDLKSEFVYQVDPLKKVSDYSVGEDVTLNCELFTIEVSNGYGKKTSAYRIRETSKKGYLKLNDRNILLSQKIDGDYPYIDMEIEDSNGIAVRLEYDNYNDSYRSAVWKKDSLDPTITKIF